MAEIFLSNKKIFWYLYYCMMMMQSVVRQTERLIGTSLPSLNDLYIGRVSVKTINEDNEGPFSSI